MALLVEGGDSKRQTQPVVRPGRQPNYLKARTPLWQGSTRNLDEIRYGESSHEGLSDADINGLDVHLSDKFQGSVS